MLIIKPAIQYISATALNNSIGLNVTLLILFATVINSLICKIDSIAVALNKLIAKLTRGGIIIFILFNFHNFLEISAFSAIIVFAILNLEFDCVIVTFSIKFSLNFLYLKNRYMF